MWFSWHLRSWSLNLLRSSVEFPKPQIFGLTAGWILFPHLLLVVSDLTTCRIEACCPAGGLEDRPSQGVWVFERWCQQAKSAWKVLGHAGASFWPRGQACSWHRTVGGKNENRAKQGTQEPLKTVWQELPSLERSYGIYLWVWQS